MVVTRSPKYSAQKFTYRRVLDKIWTSYIILQLKLIPRGHKIKFAPLLTSVSLSPFSFLLYSETVSKSKLVWSLVYGEWKNEPHQKSSSSNHTLSCTYVIWEKNPFSFFTLFQFLYYIKIDRNSTQQSKNIISQYYPIRWRIPITNEGRLNKQK